VLHLFRACFLVVLSQQSINVGLLGRAEGLSCLCLWLWFQKKVKLGQRGKI
jgi:hypothetical protein